MSDIPPIHLADLKRKTEDLNTLVAELIERHGDQFNIQMFVSYQEGEAPGVTVTIRQVFAEYGKRAGFSR